MTVTAVVGSQWGDEGKGKVVDYLAESADYVARFNGGNNAGHTVINEYGAFKIHLVPSGIFARNAVGLIGGGVVVDPQVLIDEIEMLNKAGAVAPRRRSSWPSGRARWRASAACSGRCPPASTCSGWRASRWAPTEPPRRSTRAPRSPGRPTRPGASKRSRKRAASSPAPAEQSLQAAAQEAELVGGDPLERLTAKGVVVPAGVEAQLSLRGRFGGAPAQLGRVDVVVLRDAVKDRAGDAAGLSGQPVGRRERRPRTERVAPARLGRGHRLEAGLGVGTGEQAERAGRAGGGDAEGLGATQRPGAVAQPGPREAQDVAGSADVDQGTEAVDDRSDTDRRGDPGLRQSQRLDMAAAQRVAPERDPICVYGVERTRAADRGAPVVALAPGEHQPTRLATAATEVAVVEGEGGESGIREAFRVQRQALVVDARGAGAEDDAGNRVIAACRRSEEPGGALPACRLEAKLLDVHRRPYIRVARATTQSSRRAGSSFLASAWPRASAPTR